LRPLAEYERLAEKSLADLRHAARTVRDESAALKKYRAEAAAAREAQGVLQAAAQAVQQAAHEQVARVVTKCLRAVFGENSYGFVIEFDRKRGRTEARLSFTRGGHLVDPANASGGGVVDVAAFALRVAALILSVPPRRRLLVLDEPFKHISRNHAGVVRELIETLARELQIQIIMVTHSEELACGKIVRVGKQ
jgi:DNA repair exonuclease SbcCD ATPase subunit